MLPAGRYSASPGSSQRGGAAHRIVDHPDRGDLHAVLIIDDRAGLAFGQVDDPGSAAKAAWPRDGRTVMSNPVSAVDLVGLGQAGNHLIGPGWPADRQRRAA